MCFDNVREFYCSLTAPYHIVFCSKHINVLTISLPLCVCACVCMCLAGPPLPRDSHILTFGFKQTWLTLKKIPQLKETFKFVYTHTHTHTHLSIYSIYMHVSLTLLFVLCIDSFSLSFCTLMGTQRSHMYPQSLQVRFLLYGIYYYCYYFTEIFYSS